MLHALCAGTVKDYACEVVKFTSCQVSNRPNKELTPNKVLSIFQQAINIFQEL